QIRAGQNASSGSSTFKVKTSSLANLQGTSFNYRLPHQMATLLSKGSPLSKDCQIRQGLATTDNNRFVKYAWQVEPDKINHIWYPYAKGSGAEKWYSPVLHVVDWENDGMRIKNSVNEKYPYLKGKVAWVVKNESYYFKKGLCFSFVNTRSITVRSLPPGCIFDVSASAIFPEQINADFLLGYLNSAIVVALLRSMNPTINYQVGDLKRLPLIGKNSELENQVADSVRACLRARKQIESLSNPLILFSVVDREIEPFDLAQDNNLTDKHKRYTDLLARLNQSILDNEALIDKNIFDLLKNHQGWDDTDTKEIAAWLSTYNQDQRQDKQTPTPVYGRMYGRKSFLDNLILEDLINTYLSIRPLQFLQGGKEIEINFELIDNHRARRQKIKFHLDKVDLAFIEESAGLNVIDYLTLLLTSHMNKLFHQNPPFRIGKISLEKKKRYGGEPEPVRWK
ncbi:MAG: hypothetical protein K8F91_14025, partial [Candidatus Obscuribacterales bacterium]|nr:hypothetical protein [Candidatus Obscuribacterales bacterium]